MRLTLTEQRLPDNPTLLAYTDTDDEAEPRADVASLALLLRPARPNGDRTATVRADYAEPASNAMSCWEWPALDFLEAVRLQILSQPDPVQLVLIPIGPTLSAAGKKLCWDCGRAEAHTGATRCHHCSVIRKKRYDRERYERKKIAV